MDDLPHVQLRRFYRGASTAGIWNLTTSEAPARIFRLYNHGAYWRGFEVDPLDDSFASYNLSAPTRRQLIESIRIALWAEVSRLAGAEGDSRTGEPN